MSRSIRTRVVVTLAILAALVPFVEPASTAEPGDVPGVSSFGRERYIEYIAGSLPLIFSAPHGGSLTPPEIPDRTAEDCAGTEPFSTATDWNTQPLARAILAAFYARTGRYPHVIINRLHRQKLDANRTLAGGACSDPEAQIAWREYHEFIELAKSRAVAEYGAAWYTDVHGHGHAVPRLELGYRLTAGELRLDDATLDGQATYESKSSFFWLSQVSPLSFAALLRGPTGLGTLLADHGYPSVPSAQDPAPTVKQAYFDGGYNTSVHGCSAGGPVCGVQIEHHYTGVRDTAANRAAYATALVRVYETFLAQNFGVSLASPAGETIVDDENRHNDVSRARFSPTTSWTLSPAATGGHLTTHHVSTGAGPTNDGAQFYFHVPAAGVYSVYAWWTSDPTRTASASYRVFEIDGGTLLKDVRVSQQANGGQWNLLGTWTFRKVGWAKVFMSRSLSKAGTISADAIRAVRLP
jgi:hypothetical protein